MTSDAAVMSKPDSRGTPFAAPPSPTTIWRSARSLMSTARRHETVSGSMCSSLPSSRCAVDDRREHVVGRADRVDVAGEVQVEVLHRDDLGVAAARRAALQPEHRARATLRACTGSTARRYDRGPGSGRPTSSTCPRRSGSASCPRRRSACRRGCRRAARTQVSEIFALSPSVRLDLRLQQPGRVRDLPDRPHVRGLCNLKIRLH